MVSNTFLFYKRNTDGSPSKVLQNLAGISATSAEHPTLHDELLDLKEQVATKDIDTVEGVPTTWPIDLDDKGILICLD